MSIKISVLCCTYLRPKSLEYIIQCFFDQDYNEKELIILDDAGQYDNQSGDNWKLISTECRYRTLGEKRNAIAKFASHDSEIFAIWDDDDLYLPWALSASVKALRNADWSRPSLVIYDKGGPRLYTHKTEGLFQGGWAFKRKIFEKAGGYPLINIGEDLALAERFSALKPVICDPCGIGFSPFYIYRWENEVMHHLTGPKSSGYDSRGKIPRKKTRVTPKHPNRLNNVVIDTKVRERGF